VYLKPRAATDRGLAWSQHLATRRRATNDE
jgi:hypothetical protein